jgi:ABC-2 type transport system ATP-binding protein
MDEADRCSRVGLIYQGRIVICDSPAKVRESIGADVIKIVTPDWQKARELLSTLPGVQELQSYGEALHVLVDSGRKQHQAIKKTLRKNQVKTIEYREIAPRMEEAFISLIKRMDQVR